MEINNPTTASFTGLFFFYLGFLSRTFTIYRTARKGGGYFCNSSLPLLSGSQTLLNQLGNYCRELTSAHSQQLDINWEHLIFGCKLLTTKLRTLSYLKKQGSFLPQLYSTSTYLNYRIVIEIKKLFTLSFFFQRPFFIFVTMMIVYKFGDLNFSIHMPHLKSLVQLLVSNVFLKKEFYFVYIKNKQQYLLSLKT